MTAPRLAQPPLLCSVGLAVLLLLCAAATATADVTGKVTTPAGVPVPGAFVRATHPDGSFASSDSTDASGAYSLRLDADEPAPFTLRATFTDRCRDTGDELEATATVPDGAVQNLLLDARTICGTAFLSQSDPLPTGFVDAARGRVLSRPGGLTYVRVLAPSTADALTLKLADGTPVGSSETATRSPCGPRRPPTTGP